MHYLIPVGLLVKTVNSWFQTFHVLTTLVKTMHLVRTTLSMDLNAIVLMVFEEFSVKNRPVQNTIMGKTAVFSVGLKTLVQDITNATQRLEKRCV